MMNICGGPSVLHEGFSSGCVTEIKQAVKIPVITVGRYTEPQYAELMVEEGRADLIAFGRQSIADPELPRKAKGRRTGITPAVYWNVCRDVCQTCSGEEAITCLVNPLAGREAELDLAEQKKKGLSLSAEDREVYMRHMYVRF